MLQFLTTLALIMNSAVLFSATYNAEEYTYPLEEVERLYSGSFGEMRTGHFHSGVDIKTDGVEGKRVVASSDGYVSRISLSPSGYGLALYLAHPNGTTTLYGHLSQLRDDIQEYLINERYRTKQHALNIYPKKSQFQVAKGELIAYSGNTGSSGGPHLHFEVRDAAQRPLNPVAMGIITPADTIRPMILNVYYAETHTIRGVCYTKRVSKYPVSQLSNGDYTLAERDVMWVGREGYFIFEATDRRQGVTNTFGIYNLSGEIDQKPFYTFQHDGFSFDETRCCNAISYYPYQKSTSSEHFRMKRLEGVPKGLLKYTDNNGVITTEAGDTKEVVIVATDDVGNSSTLAFTIRGKDDADCFEAVEVDEERIVRPYKSYTYNDGELAVTIPAGVLYEPEVFTSSVADLSSELPSGVKGYSRSYSVMDPNTPLHSAITISIKADVPPEEQPHIFVVETTRSGRTYPATAKYKDGWATMTTRSTGSYYVAVDDVAPRITPSFEPDATLSGAKSISFAISDNYSGVSSYSATLDGEWIALDLAGSTLTHTFREAGDGEPHEVVITVSDLCKNSTTIKRSFIR